jgi:hypothetical protein
MTADAIREFQTKASDRWGDTVSPEGMLDMALRGTREQWWELYELAQRDAGFRTVLRHLLQRADPDLRGGARLWAALLERLDARELDANNS